VRGGGEKGGKRKVVVGKGILNRAASVQSSRAAPAAEPTYACVGGKKPSRKSNGVVGSPKKRRIRPILGGEF